MPTGGTTVRVLFLSGSATATSRWTAELAAAGLEVTAGRAASVAELERVLDRGPWDVVLVGPDPPRAELPVLLGTVLRHDPAMGVLALAGSGERESAAEALAAGASAVVPASRPWLVRAAVLAEARRAAWRHDREDARRRLLEHEASYQSLFHLAPLAIYVQERDGTFLDVNRRAEEMYGYPREFFVGRSPADLAAADRNDLEAVAAKVRDAYDRGTTHAFEFWGVRADGTEFPKEVIVTGGIFQGRRVVLAFARDITDRKRDEELLLRRLHQLEVVSRIAVAVTSQLEVQEILETAAREIHERLGYHSVIVLLHDPERGVLGRQAVAGAYADLAPPGYTQRVGVGLIGAAAATGRTQLEPDVSRSQRYTVGFRHEVPTRSEVAVPVKAGERVLAVLDVQETEVDAFDEADVLTLETIARQLAVALENARLFARLQEELEERQRAEAALRESEERYRDLVENATELIGTHALDGTILSMNRAALEVLGLDPDGTAGRNLKEFIAPEYRGQYAAYVDRLLREGQASGLMRVVLPDGSHRLWSYRSSLRTEGVEEPVVRALVRDITEEWQARRRLEESERRYRDLVERAGIGILVDDAEGRILYCNDRVAAMFARPREELEGRAIWELIHPGDRERVRQLHRRRLAGEEDVPSWYEFRGVRPDGSEVYLEVTATPRREGGRIVGTRSYLRDVSDRRELEQQLLQAQKLESLGRLAGGIAHDFNNILQVIVAHLDGVLLGAGPGSELHHRLEAARQAALRGGELVRQLLLFSRRQKPAVELLELNALVEDLHGMLERVIGEDVRLELATVPEELWLEADRTQLQQVLTNLVVNARDATPAGGVIRVATGVLDTREGDQASRPTLAPGRYALLVVEDTGRGIPPEDLERIFDPFFTTKGPARGTGLGLATVHGIVQQHGGAVEVVSEVGRGTRFTVHLPLAERPGTPSSAVPALEEGDGAVPGGGGELILVVEDDPGVREALAGVLEAQGYRVVTVADGTEALEAFQRWEDEVALLLTDVVLPDISGSEVARRIRQRRPGLPVVFSSGYSEDQMNRTLPTDERTELLSKPYDLRRLMATLRRLLHPGEGTREGT